MLEEIYKLHPTADSFDIALKLNELIDAFNESTKSARVEAERISKYGHLNSIQIEALESVRSGLKTIDAIAEEWNVWFDDRDQKTLETRVFCRRCKMPSQSLFDRMLAPKDPSKCEGCIHQMKWG